MNDGFWTRWFVIAVLFAGVAALLMEDAPVLTSCLFVNLPRGGHC